MDTVGKRIAASRKSLGYTQEQLVGKISKGISMLREWERAVRTPDDGDLIQLAGVLGVNFKWLKEGEGPMRDGDADSDQTVTVDLDVMPGEIRSELGFVLDEDGEIERYILLKVIGLTKEEGDEMRKKEREG